jgi:hypothetical protein
VTAVELPLVDLDAVQLLADTRNQLDQALERPHLAHHLLGG